MAPGDFKVMSHKMTTSLEIHTLHTEVMKSIFKEDIYLKAFFK